MVMPPQRACVAESQVKHRSSNGPPRVQSNGCGIKRYAQRQSERSVSLLVHDPEYSATSGCALIIRDMIVSC